MLLCIGSIEGGVLQRAAFKHFEELRYFAMSSVANIDKRDSLAKHFKPLTLVFLMLQLF